MKPAIYQPGEKIIVVSDLTQWANHSHVKTWDEAKEISQNSEFVLQANYTMHQAQLYSDSVKKDVAQLGLIDAIYSNECLVARPI